MDICFYCVYEAQIQHHVGMHACCLELSTAKYVAHMCMQLNTHTLTQYMHHHFPGGLRYKLLHLKSILGLQAGSSVV